MWRFILTAVLLLGGLCILTAGVIGTWRFPDVMSRIHAAGLGDTLAMALCTLALVCSADSLPLALRFCMPIAFLYLSSPVSSHFLSQIEYYSDLKHYRSLPRQVLPKSSDPES